MFLVGLDFSAMLDCAGSSNPQSHRLTGSLKVIDTEIQELTKSKSNIVGILVVAWALFIGVERRRRRSSQERKQNGGELLL